MSIEDNNPYSPLLLDAETTTSKPELEEKWSKTDTSKGDKVVTSLEEKDLSQFKTDNMTLKPSKLTSEKEFVKGAQTKEAQQKDFRLKTPEKQPQKQQPAKQIPKAPPLPNQQAQSRQQAPKIQSVEFTGKKFSATSNPNLEPVGKVSLKSEGESIQDPKDFLEKRPISEALGSELRDVTQDIPDPINTDEEFEETTPVEGNNPSTVQSYLDQSETEKERLQDVLEKHNIQTHPVEPLDVDVEESVQNLNKKTTPVEDEFYNVKEENLNTGLENKEEINPSPLIGTFNITKKPILHRNFDVAETDEGTSNPPVSENEAIDQSQENFPPLSENMEDYVSDEKPEWVERSK